VALLRDALAPISRLHDERGALEAIGDDDHMFQDLGRRTVQYDTIRYGTVRQAGNILKQLYGSYTKTGSRYVVNTVPGYSRRRAGSHEQRRSISRCSGKLRVSLLCCRLLSSTSASYGVSAPSNRVQFPTSKLNNPPTSDHGAPNRRPEGEKPSKSTGLQA
jgi:hypothetical protein